MSNKDLGENTSRQEADEADLLDNEMEHEAATTPTMEIQENLQNASLGEKEKFESELTTIAPLLDQVRMGIIGFLFSFRTPPPLENTPFTDVLLQNF